MVDEQTGYDDEQDRVDRENERIREERWAEFVRDMRNALCNGDLVSVLQDLVSVMVAVDDEVGIDEPEIIMASFAKTEGWDGVLNAIARAYREEQKKG